MKLIKLARGKGKTKRLINKAHNNSIYIVCPNRQRAYYIFQMSQKMGKNILFPISLDEIIMYRMTGNNVKKYLIDDIDDIATILIYRYLLKPIYECGEVLEVTASVTNLAKLIGAENDL